MTMTSPVSGTQRSVTMVGEHAQSEAINIFNFSQAGWLDSGRIGGITLSNRGTGYIAPPTVHFYGAGYELQLQPQLLVILLTLDMVK